MDGKSSDGISPSARMPGGVFVTGPTLVMALLRKVPSVELVAWRLQCARANPGSVDGREVVEIREQHLLMPSLSWSK